MIKVLTDQAHEKETHIQNMAKGYEDMKTWFTEQFQKDTHVVRIEAGQQKLSEEIRQAIHDFCKTYIQNGIKEISDNARANELSSQFL